MRRLNFLYRAKRLSDSSYVLILELLLFGLKDACASFSYKRKAVFFDRQPICEDVLSRGGVFSFSATPDSHEAL